MRAHLDYVLLGRVDFCIKGCYQIVDEKSLQFPEKKFEFVLKRAEELYYDFCSKLRSQALIEIELFLNHVVVELKRVLKIAPDFNQVFWVETLLPITRLQFCNPDLLSLKLLVEPLVVAK